MGNLDGEGGRWDDFDISLEAFNDMVEVCLYICMCIYICVYVFIHVNTYIYVYIHIYMC
jgi:hypothetical protein